MVRKYSRSKHRVSRKVRKTTRRTKRRTRRTKRRTTRRQRGGFTTGELVGAAAVGLGLSALGYKIYNKREDYEALVHSDSEDSSHGHMTAADNDLHFRYSN